MNNKQADQKTIDYYDKSHEEYDTSTSNINLTEQWRLFLTHVKSKGLILDVGCGSGRDILHFQSLGFLAEGIEPSSQMAKISRKRTNAFIEEISVENLNQREKYDGIWACASLLHLPKSKLPNILNILTRALKEGAPLYISLKHGRGEVRKVDGRLFSNYLPSEIIKILKQTPNLENAKIWTTEDIKLRHNTKWINVLLKKSLTHQAEHTHKKLKIFK